MTLPTILDDVLRHTAERPGRLAFEVSGESATYAELVDRVRRMAAGMEALGAGPGERMAIALPTSLDAVIAVLAAQWTGAAPVVIDGKLPAPMILRRVELVRAKAVVVPEELKAPLGELDAASRQVLVTAGEVVERAGDRVAGDHRAKLEAPAYLQLTSGTIGEPKAAVISHSALSHFVKTLREYVQMGPEEICLTWVPLYHDYGLINFLFFPLHMGCEGHLIPPAVSNFAKWLREIDRLRATITGGPDFGYRIAARLVKPETVDLTCLKWAGCGGEPVKPDTIRNFEEKFRLPSPILPGYGQAETTLIISGPRPGDALRIDASGNVANGQPLPGFEVRIASDEGVALPPGEVGQIHVKGPCVFDGYFEDADATAAVFVDGWLDTGDTGYLDAEGYLFILGRRRAMIKRGGSLLAPREIEEASERVEGVRRCAAIGVPEAEGSHGEMVVVLAEVAPGKFPTPEDRAAVAEAISKSIDDAMGHPPGDVILVKPSSIDLTPNGKIRYPTIRAKYTSGELRAAGRIIYPEGDGPETEADSPAGAESVSSNTTPSG